MAFPIAHGSINDAIVPPYKFGNNVHVANERIVPHRPSMVRRSCSSGSVSRAVRYRNPRTGKAGVANAVVADTRHIRMNSGGR